MTDAKETVTPTAAEKEEDTKVIKVVTFINLYLISCNTKHYMHCKNRLINCP